MLAFVHDFHYAYQTLLPLISVLLYYLFRKSFAEEHLPQTGLRTNGEALSRLDDVYA